MTYINAGNRVALDVIIDGLVKRLRSIEGRKDDVNYTVTRVALGALKPYEGWDYHSLSAAVGALKDSAAEIERRLLSPYEDMALNRHGDIDCFKEPFAYAPTEKAQ